jgi:hypothetical protein
VFVPKIPELTSNIDLQPLYGHAALSALSAEMIQSLLARISTEQHSASLFMQMYYILDHLDFTELALEMQDKALSLQHIYRLTNNNMNSEAPPLRLLALVGRGNLSDNAPLDYITDHCNISLDLLYVLDDLTLPKEIPDHDAVIVALGEKDDHQVALNFMQSLKSKWPKPWINDPRNILFCARDKLPERLKNIPDVIVPETIRINRTCKTLPFFPATIRPIDTHSGKGLKLLHNGKEFADYLTTTHGESFYVSRFYETDRDDGLYRKIRIALIEGKPYICHVALSQHWIVHFISAQMHLNMNKMDEEKSIMDKFESDLFASQREAFENIAIALGLEFVVLDCEINNQNKIILFEADNRGWIHATDPDDIFPYKKPVMDKAFTAFRTMVSSKSKSIS